MTTAELKDRVCSDLVLGYHARGGRSFISTRFQYPGGDHVVVYLDIDDSGNLILSDRGQTHFFLGRDGVEMTDRRLETVRSVCALYGTSWGEETRHLTVPLSHDEPGQSLLTLCEAITRVSSLVYHRQPHGRASLSREVGDLFREYGIATKRPYVRKWYDGTVTGGSDHPVDYHFNTQGVARNLYLVTSTMRAEQTVSTIYFWEAKGRGSPSLSLIATDLHLPMGLKRKLAVASEVDVGVVGNEKLITEFVTATGRPKAKPLGGIFGDHTGVEEANPD